MQAGRLDLFTRGPDKALHQRTFANGAWTNWTGWANLGGATTSAPGVVSTGNGHMDIFAQTYSYVDNAGRVLYGLQTDPDDFGSVEWTDLSGYERFTGEPALEERPDSRVQLAAQHTDGDVWTWTQADPDGPALGSPQRLRGHRGAGGGSRSGYEPDHGGRPGRGQPGLSRHRDAGRHQGVG